jgi:hypothetical protein
MESKDQYNSDRIIGWTGFWDECCKKWRHNPIYKFDPIPTEIEKLIEKYHSKRKLKYISRLG